MSDSTIVDLPLDTDISDALTDLALDLRWSFNHSADQLWEQLDPELWELTHNPWVLLQIVSRGINIRDVCDHLGQWGQHSRTRP